MRTVLLGLVLAGCVPDAKANQCAWWGELSGSAACSMSNASWDSSRTSMELTNDLSDTALIKVTIDLEGAPVVGSAKEPGCNVWFFDLSPPIGDNTRDAQTFRADALVPCEVRLTEVVAIDDHDFTVHGVIETGVAGGKSVFSPLRRARLAAGF